MQMNDYNLTGFLGRSIAISVVITFSLVMPLLMMKGVIEKIATPLSVERLGN